MNYGGDHTLYSMNIKTEKKNKKFKMKSSKSFPNRSFCTSYFMGNIGLSSYVLSSLNIDKNNNKKYIKYSTYNQLLLIGGRDSVHSRNVSKCELIAFNEKYNNNVNIINLPSLPFKVSSSSVIYYNNIIFNIGGLCDKPTNKIHALDINNKYMKYKNIKKELNWIDVTNNINILKSKYASSICFITNNKLMIIGGCPGFAVATKTCELYEFDIYNNNKNKINYFDKYNKNKSIS